MHFTPVNGYDLVSPFGGCNKPRKPRADTRQARHITIALIAQLPGGSVRYFTNICSTRTRQYHFALVSTT
jgi:hypothetical protein